MLESAQILLEIFVAWLENCSKYLLLSSAWLGFYLKLNCSKMLCSIFKFPARRALMPIEKSYLLILFIQRLKFKALALT